MRKILRNPGRTLSVIDVRLAGSTIKIVPYHLLPEGTHKMVSYFGIFQSLPADIEELIEASTGNAAIAASLYAKEFGLPIRIFMPEGMSEMKKRTLKSLGVRVIETPRALYTKGARDAAQQYSAEHPRSFYLRQTHNPGNYKGHQEMAHKLKNTDHFVCIGGTFGTIRGYADYLKKNKGAGYLVTEIDLDAAPHIYNKKMGLETKWVDHGIVGAAPSVRPDHADHTKLDLVVVARADECEQLFKEALRCKLNVGKSSAVNLAIAKRMADMYPGQTIGTVTFDHLDRYDGIDDLATYNFDVDSIRQYLQSAAVDNMKILIERLK